MYWIKFYFVLFSTSKQSSNCTILAIDCGDEVKGPLGYEALWQAHYY